jgi:hypothetical protein
MSYDDEHPRWSLYDRAQTAAADMRNMLSMHGSKEHIRLAIGPRNYERAFEYLDCIDKNLPRLQEHIRDLILLAERLSSGTLEVWDVALIARARADAGLIEDDSDHEGTAQ